MKAYDPDRRSFFGRLCGLFVAAVAPPAVSPRQRSKLQFYTGGRIPGGLRSLGLDWKVEVARRLDEMKFEAETQAQLELQACMAKQLQEAATKSAGYDRDVPPTPDPLESPMLTPTFPSSFPTDAVSLLASKLRGAEVSVRDLATAAWILAGYAAGIALGTPQVMNSAGVAARLSDEEALTTLEAMLPRDEGHPVVAAIAIPWGRLAQWAFGKFIELVLATS